MVVSVEGECPVGFPISGCGIHFAQCCVSAVCDDLAQPDTGVCLVFAFMPEPGDDLVCPENLSFGELAVLAIDPLFVVAGKELLPHARWE